MRTPCVKKSCEKINSAGDLIVRGKPCLSEKHSLHQFNTKHSTNFQANHFSCLKLLPGIHLVPKLNMKISTRNLWNIRSFAVNSVNYVVMHVHSQPKCITSKKRDWPNWKLFFSEYGICTEQLFSDLYRNSYFFIKFLTCQNYSRSLI